MARTVIRLGPGECSDVETGARFYALLAFPAASEQQQREEAALAKAAEYLHEANRVDGSDLPFEDPRLNELVSLSLDWCRPRVRTLKRRLKDRGEIAQALRPWVRQVLGGSHRPVAGIKKFTQRQISLFLCGNDVERAANFQKRVWRPSRPVLHICVAQDFWMTLKGFCPGTHDIDLASIYEVESIVHLSNQFARYLCSDPRFGVNEATLLKLEWVT